MTDPREAELARIRSEFLAEMTEVAVRRREAYQAYEQVQEEFLATFRKVQRAGELKTNDVEEIGVKVGGMPRASLYRELAKLAQKEGS